MIESSGGRQHGNAAGPRTKMQWAKALAGKGLRVFPLFSPVFHEDGTASCSCGNSQCACIGKHPRIGEYPEKATTDVGQIEKWWNFWPDANIGIATGGDSRLFVIDVDGPEGKESMEHLQGDLGNLPETLTVKTGREEGGQHAYFWVPEGAKIHGTVGAIAPGIDTRGFHNYVVGPGSVHESGRLYSLVDEAVEIAELPKAWMDFLVREQAKKETRHTPGKERGKPVNVEEEKIPEGSRNSRLHEIACSLVHKGLSRKAVLKSIMALNETTCEPPLGEAEVGNIVSSAWSYREGNRPERDTERQLRLGLSDNGNTERLKARFNGRLLWNSDRCAWMIYDGKCWKEDRENRAESFALSVIQDLQKEAQGMEDPRDRALTNDFALKCQTPVRVQAALAGYRMDPKNTARDKDFDTQPHLLNCGNGVVDLKSMTLLPHDPSLRLSHCVPVDYDPKAQCPTFLAFLKKILLDDPEAIACVRRFIGYACTGETGEQFYFIWLGNGQNGKSVLASVLMGILDTYARSCMASAFTVKRNDSSTHELADLVGSRVVFSGEVPETAQLNEPVLKMLTGGDTFRYRQLYQKSREAKPTFKIVLPCNRLPRIYGLDNGIWRRCFIIRFDYRVSEAERIENYEKVLLQEKEGILAWAVAAAKEWYENGLLFPAKFRDEVASFRNDSDPLARFLEEACEIGFGRKASFQDLYGRYLRWCESRHESPMSSNKFGTELRERRIPGVAKDKSRNGVVYSGIGLKPDSPLSDLDFAVNG